jgi:hypothetical protein
MFVDTQAETTQRASASLNVVAHFVLIPARDRIGCFNDPIDRAIQTLTCLAVLWGVALQRSIIAAFVIVNVDLPHVAQDMPFSDIVKRSKESQKSMANDM